MGPQRRHDTVLFDLDGTLCEYRRPGAEVLDLAFDRVGVEPLFSMADYRGIFDDHVEASDTVEENRERCFADLAAGAGADPETGRAVARAYADERDHRDVRFLPGVREALDRLAPYRLGIVTNGAPDMQSEKLAALGIADRFETVVHAGYGTPAKPDPEPFRLALSALGVSSGRAVHVGNSLEADVAGANAAGLTSVWVPDRTAGDGMGVEPDHRLDSLDGLDALL